MYKRMWHDQFTLISQGTDIMLMTVIAARRISRELIAPACAFFSPGHLPTRPVYFEIFLCMYPYMLPLRKFHLLVYGISISQRLPKAKFCSSDDQKKKKKIQKFLIQARELSPLRFPVWQHLKRIYFLFFFFLFLKPVQIETLGYKDLGMKMH